MKKHFAILSSQLLLLIMLLSCGGGEELTLEEAQALKEVNRGDILSRTVNRPGGEEPFSIGKSGGTWKTSVTNDPKTFNLIVSENDGTSSGIIGPLFPAGFSDYDPYSREWEPEIASHDIRVYEEEGRMDVFFTLRDDLYWTYYDRDEKVKITSDDVIFWYNEIDGNPEMQRRAYNSQFVDMEDGSVEHIDIEKIDERTFVFHYPRTVANPLLGSNMEFGPKFLFEPALEKGGPEGVKEIFTIDMDVKDLPSGGSMYLVEYTPGVRLVYEENPHYYDKDAAGNKIPYIQKSISKIVPDLNTEFLLFKNGEKDAYNVRAEDLEEMVNQENRDYTVYNGGATFNAEFISFNQNPQALPEYMQQWFIQKEFRQAMSCLVNRPRIIKQIQRGLGTPFSHFFLEANMFHNPDIKLDYTYSPDRAMELLSSIGMTKDDRGVLRDASGNAVEFDIITNSDNNTRIDTANIFIDECSKVGIKVSLKPLDFQKMVDMLTQSYDWHAVLLSFGGLPYFPTQGSNVWQSDGNLHIWHPLQETPVTDWEARMDYLYNEATYTPDREKARPYWDEYQQIVLDQLPLIYLVQSNSFLAVRDKWENVYYDTLGGLKSQYLYLKE